MEGRQEDMESTGLGDVCVEGGREVEVKGVVWVFLEVSKNWSGGRRECKIYLGTDEILSRVG